MTRTSVAILLLALLMIVSGCAQQAPAGPATTGPPAETPTAPPEPSPTPQPTATETAPPTPTETVTPPPPTVTPSSSICSPGVADIGEGGQP